VLADACPWPTVRAMWRASVARWADWFVAGEAGRRAIGTPEALEQMGEITLPEIDFTLRGKADRFDLTPDGRLMIYDYKSGDPPSVKQQLAFDKQLLIEAAMVERGAFEDPGPVPVQGAEYIALGPEKTVAAPLAQQPPEQVWEELLTLLRGWQAPDRGYTARRAVARQAFDSPFDHLSRFGEWDETTRATPVDVGRG
jgi:ATP-dependent helicase/nuclease subunit B